MAALLQITAKCYYKLRQLYQIITNYASFSCYYKLRQHIITNYGSLLQIATVRYYKLWQLYYKLRQNAITNYGSFIKLLQITAAFRVITNYGNTLLQITAGITIYGVITNYVVTCTTIFHPNHHFFLLLFFFVC